MNTKQQTPTTVIEWLEKAKADGDYWADAAIANAVKQGVCINKRVNSKSDAILYGFGWRYTPEYQKNIQYWKDIWSSINA